MINYSNPVLIRLRSFGRTLGVLRPAVIFYRRHFGSGYEQRFDDYMMSRIAPGDVVWDVGANVGHFTERFLSAVGPSGKVVAFEPSPTAQAALHKRFQNSQKANLAIEALALGSSSDTVTFWYSADEADSVTDGMGFKEGAASTTVQVMAGEDYLEAHPDLTPNCIKIDVEGFESDVLNGMKTLLKNPRLRAVFVEVHFEHSARRGLNDAPNAVVSLLRQSEFSVNWVDPSHIAAEKT